MVQQSIDAGITYVVAAGNTEDDACNCPPAHLDAVIAVEATEV